MPVKRCRVKHKKKENFSHPITAKLAFEDGRVFQGFAFGSSGTKYGEVVFNTSHTGYQEILTDPSYKGQIVLMTYPLIGNYGVNSEDVESRKLFIEGFIIKELSPTNSNWRSEGSLETYLKENDVIGIQGVDTRAITKHIRTQGAMKAVISTEDYSDKDLVKMAKSSSGLIGRDLVKEVSVSDTYNWSDEGKYKVAVLDCGVKYNILRILKNKGCQVKVFPANTNAEQILKDKPDGILLSNGPGDPEGVPYIIETVKKLLGKAPIFGICLGQQILGLALGGKTYKLKFGHHGANQPVKDLATGKIYITSQNHGFCVDVKQGIGDSGQGTGYYLSGNDEVEVTHINLNDRTCEGMRHKKMPVFSVQFHPEHSPGPHEAEYLFDEFIKMMDKSKCKY